jgi:hypothetical protein
MVCGAKEEDHSMGDEKTYLSKDTQLEWPALDRRHSGRHYCHGGLLVRFIVRPSFQPSGASVHDISPRGMGLLVRRQIPTGTPLAIQFQSRYTGVSGILTATVKHLERLADHCWLLGCILSRPLAEPEFNSVVEVA